MKNQLIVLWVVTLMLAVPIAYAGSLPATINVTEGPEGTLPTVFLSGFDIQTPDIASADPEDVAIGSLQAGVFHTSSPDTGLSIAYAFMLEPGSREISDFVTLVFIVTGGEASVVEFFASDKSDDLGVLGAGFPALVENGKLQDLSSIFANAAGVPVALPAGLVIGVQSDISEVPEPATWILLATGVPGLITSRRWRRPRAV
jgi:hypothetical protein